MRVFISAGEASGDALGAALIASLKAKRPDLYAFGMGGPKMAAQGFDQKKSAGELNVIGLFEVLSHLPRLFRLRDELVHMAVEGEPDVAVLIDVPDFNLRVARKLKKSGIPICFYVGPSVWAWRPGRVRTFKAVLDRLLVLFPFEPPIWKASGVDVVWVGHPFADQIPAPVAGAMVRAKQVALLPGSRKSEVLRHLPIMLEAASRLIENGMADRFVLPVAPTLDPAWLASLVHARGLSDRVELVNDPEGEARRSAVASSSIALVVSGTATLETALIGRPQVIFYKVHWLTHLLGRHLMRVKWFGLPNLLAGRSVAPELLQRQVTARALVEEASRLLTDEAARNEATQGAAEVRRRLGEPGAADRAADAVLELVRARTSPPLDVSPPTG